MPPSLLPWPSRAERPPLPLGALLAVPGQVGRVGEAEAAVGAAVAPLPGVHHPVVVQVRLAGEALAAHGALEGPATRVRPLVHLNVRPVVARVGAVGTAVLCQLGPAPLGLPAPVDALPGRGQVLPAELAQGRGGGRTGVGTRGGVPHSVPPQVGKPAPARAAASHENSVADEGSSLTTRDAAAAWANELSSLRAPTE